MGVHVVAARPMWPRPWPPPERPAPPTPCPPPRMPPANSYSYLSYLSYFCLAKTAAVFHSGSRIGANISPHQILPFGRTNPPSVRRSSRPVPFCGAYACQCPHVFPRLHGGPPSTPSRYARCPAALACARVFANGVHMGSGGSTQKLSMGEEADEGSGRRRLTRLCRGACQRPVGSACTPFPPLSKHQG